MSPISLSPILDAMIDLMVADAAREEDSPDWKICESCWAEKTKHNSLECSECVKVKK